MLVEMTLCFVTELGEHPFLAFAAGVAFMGFIVMSVCFLTTLFDTGKTK